MARFRVEVTTSVAWEFDVDPLLGEAMRLEGLPNGDAITINPRTAVAAMEQGIPQVMRVAGSAPGQTYVVSVRAL